MSQRQGGLLAVALMQIKEDVERIVNNAQVALRGIHFLAQELSFDITSQKRDEGRTVHPWGAFLAARTRCIHWLTEDGKTDEEIAQTLSMDGPVQVQLIRASTTKETA